MTEPIDNEPPGLAYFRVAILREATVDELMEALCAKSSAAVILIETPDGNRAHWHGPIAAVALAIMRLAQTFAGRLRERCDCRVCEDIARGVYFAAQEACAHWRN